jgi:hypothetical protein
MRAGGILEAVKRDGREQRRDEMSTFQQDVNSAIGRYQDMVWAGERQAVRIAGVAPRSMVQEKLYRKAAHWLGARLVSWGEGLRRSGAMPAPGEQSVG